MMIEGDVVVVVVVVENTAYTLILYQIQYQRFTRFTDSDIPTDSPPDGQEQERHTRHIHTYTYDDESKNS